MIILLLTHCNRLNEICQNEIQIVAPENLSPIINLNYNQNQESLIKEVESYFKHNLCSKEVEIGIQLANKRIIKTIFHKDRIISRSSEVIILMNQEGEVLINGKNYIKQLDSLAIWISRNFPNDENNDTEEIIFEWDEESPKEKIELGFTKIVEGYLKSYENISKTKYFKPFCELSEFEVNEILKEHEFRIKLGFGQIKIIPPPIN